jgi:hypothetical protein
MIAFIASDWCGWGDRYGRYTHIPSGETIIEYPYDDQSSWDARQVAFFRRHPGLRVYVCLGRYTDEWEPTGTTDEILAKWEARRSAEGSRDGW